LHRDAVNGRLRARRGARIAASTSGGAIPETGDYRVVTEGERVFIGTINEDFAIETSAGDIFILGNSSWRIHHVRGGEVTVSDAQGAPATIPFWLGEASARTAELSTEVSQLRSELAAMTAERPEEIAAAARWLRDECAASEWSAEQAVRYVAAQQAALGVTPSQSQIVFERFFDESGGMQLVVHSPWGARINRAWGYALRKRFCRSFDFELQAAADDNGIVLSIGPQHSFPIESLFKMLNTENARYLLEQALLAAPLFQTRWRWNVTRSLAVLRFQGGRKVPPPLQRFRADDLLAAVFPETVGCLENHEGDIEIPDHPLVRQTVHDCLHEAMDIDGWLDVLGLKGKGEIEFIARDTREPSPF
ncbi:MAG: DEAD/DEAH box helicase, partial [Planctomycetales bacterium]